jgi:hypothetical protein
MIVHISVALSKENGKWIAQWQPQACVGTVFKLERKLDKALRLAFPKANYIIQHRK